MLLAEQNGILKSASPSETALCPWCHSEVIAKCGDIKIWHWSHKSIVLCEYKPETEWHLNLKAYALVRGYSIEKFIDNHITDIYTGSTNSCIELQHSEMTAKEIKNRSEDLIKHVANVDWIFDFRHKYNKRQFLVYNKSNYYSFHQKWQKKTMTVLFSNGYPIYGNVYADLGDNIIKIKKLYDDGNGYGEYIKIYDILLNMCFLGSKCASVLT